LFCFISLLKIQSPFTLFVRWTEGEPKRRLDAVIKRLTIQKTRGKQNPRGGKTWKEH